MRIPVSLLVFLLALVVAPAAPAKKAPKGPSKTVIQRLLREHYLGDDPTNYPTYKYTFAVKSVARGAPRRGRHRADGVPANRKTTVFPIKATSLRTVTNPDGTGRDDTIKAEYVFFRDEFKAWTFRVKREKITTVRH